MAVPKKRTSVSRKGLRHAGQHHKLYRVTTVSCSNCGDYVKPHHICPACGHYNGKEVIEIKAQVEETDEE